MLTALDGEEQQLRGFGLDIDDYVTKPFSMPVLLEKVRVILRRSGGQKMRSACATGISCSAWIPEKRCWTAALWS